jgi:hypothetical protein
MMPFFFGKKKKNAEPDNPVKNVDPCLYFFRECIIFMELIALNHGNFYLSNRECIIFTEFLRKPRRNNGIFG